MSRFMRKGKTKVYFCTSSFVPSTALVTGFSGLATDLSAQINEMTGFSFSNSPIHTPDLSSAFVSQIPGEDSTQDSSLKIYEDDTTNAALTAMPKNTAGFIVIFPRGLVGSSVAAGDKADIWPVVVSSVAKQYTVANEAALIEFKFATTAPPTVEKAFT
jgi:hypothetical protein